MSEPPTRTRYFSGQFLRADDFQSEQEYFLDKSNRLNRLLHGWGVVCGLRVVPAEPASVDSVLLEPGMAIDGVGREILVPARLEVNLAVLREIDAAEKRADDGRVCLVLEYAEAQTDLKLRFDHDPDAFGDQREPSRVQEGFTLALRRELPAASDDGSAEALERICAAAREGSGGAELHRMLADLVSRPCPAVPEPADAGVCLAFIDRRDGAITAEHIDTLSCRRIVWSSARILEALRRITAAGAD